jgi:hypothetical protein
MTGTLTISSGRQWRYLWLKSITGVNLAKHCAGVFRGSYVDGLTTGPDTTKVDVEFEQLLDGATSPIAWYLCGVSKPYRWDENAHVAFVPAPGHRETIQTNGLAVRAVNLRPEWITEPTPEQIITARAEGIHDKAFTTCRNWQYAVGLRAAGRT